MTDHSRWFRVAGVTIAAVVSLLIGFAVQREHDTEQIASGRSGFIIVDAPDDAAAWRVLQKQARALDANLYRLTVDPTSSTPTRGVTAVVGDRAAFDEVFPDGRYAAFPTGVHTRLVPAGGPVRGGWFATMPTRALGPLLSDLRAAHITAVPDDVGWGHLVWFMTWRSPVVLAGAVATVAMWSLGFVRTAHRTRVTALARTLGTSVPLLRDVGMSSAAAVGAFAVLATSVAIRLWSPDSGYQVRSFLSVSAVVLLVLIASSVLGSLWAGLAPGQRRHLAAHTGWRPWRRGLLAMCAAQAVTLAVAAVLVTQTASAWTTLDSVRRSRPDWQSCAACTTTIFRGTDRTSDFDAAEAPYAATVRRIEAAGGVILASKAGIDHGGVHEPDRPDTNVIIANSAFIARARGVLPDPLTGVEGCGTWGLVLPTTARAQADEIATAWMRWFAQRHHDDPALAAPRPPRIAFVAPTRVFDYGTIDARDRMYSDAPAVVVVDASSGLLGDDTYTAAGSNGELLFTGDEAATRRALTASGVDPSVYVTDDFAHQVRRGAVAARAVLPVAAIGGATGVLLLLAMLSVTARAHVFAERDRVLLQSTLGQSALRVHARHWCREVTVLATAAVALTSVYRVGLTGPDAPAPALVGWTAVIGALLLVWTAVSVGRRSTWKELQAHDH